MRKQKNIEILEYINLNINKIPDTLVNKQNIDIKASEIIAEQNYKVYKYVPIKDITILLSDSRRLDPSPKKIETMKNFSFYLDKKNIEEYEKLTQIFKDTSLDDLKEIEEFQNTMKNKTPSKIKYSKDYLWQIYYIERTNEYYMIVPTQETEFQAFIFLLKKKIEESDEKIYVPICNLNYSGEILEPSKINQLTNNLYFFTKQWPMIYEVTDHKGKTTLNIIGNLEILDCILSDYKMIFASKSDIGPFYNLIKTLFNLQTELSSYYKIDLLLDQKGFIHFYNNKTELLLDNLNYFYKSRIDQCKNGIKDTEKIIKTLNKKISKLSNEEKDLSYELLGKQKQITTFLECKKSFFGRVKYFFKNNKKKVLSNENNNLNTQDNLAQSNDEVKDETIDNNLSNSIEDLVYICKILKNKTAEASTLRLDIQNLEIKINILKKKIDNATTFINEIESHKKSIFEFWKFTNKDEQGQLEEGITKFNESKIIERNFDFNDNFIEFSKYIDSEQRNNLRNEELNDILIATSIGLDNVFNTSITKQNFQSCIDNFTPIKIEEEYTNHREKIKNPIELLGLQKDYTKKDIIEKQKSIIQSLDKAFKTCKTNINLPVYSTIELKNRVMEFEINPQKLNLFSEDNTLYKLNIKTGTNILALSNIVFFNNRNNTLPLGMNYSTKVLVDLRKTIILNTDKKENYIIKLLDNSPEQTIKKVTIIESYI